MDQGIWAVQRYFSLHEWEYHKLKILLNKITKLLKRLSYEMLIIKEQQPSFKMQVGAIRAEWNMHYNLLIMLFQYFYF